MFILPSKFETELIQEENKNYIDDNGNEIIIGGYIKNINSLTEEEESFN